MNSKKKKKFKLKVWWLRWYPLFSILAQQYCLNNTKLNAMHKQYGSCASWPNESKKRTKFFDEQNDPSKSTLFNASTIELGKLIHACDLLRQPCYTLVLLIHPFFGVILLIQTIYTIKYLFLFFFFVPFSQLYIFFFFCSYNSFLFQ